VSDLSDGGQVHLGVQVHVGAATLMVVSAPSSKGASATLPARTPGTPPAAQCGRRDAGMLADSALACCLQLATNRSFLGQRGRGWSSGGRSGGSAREADGGLALVIDVASRRYGCDVSAALGALTLHAGLPADVAGQHPRAQVLSSRPPQIASMLETCGARRSHTAQDLKRMLLDLDELEASKVLHLHFAKQTGGDEARAGSAAAPQQLAAGRAPCGLSLHLACLALHLDVEVANAIIARVQQVCAMPAGDGEAWCPVRSVRSEWHGGRRNSNGNSHSHRSKSMQTPVRAGEPPWHQDAPSWSEEEAAEAAAAAARDLDSILDSTQLDLHVGFLSAAIGCAGGGVLAPAPHLRVHAEQGGFCDWVRATCGGGRFFWNRAGAGVAAEGGAGAVGLAAVDYLDAYAISASCTSRLLARDHTSAAVAATQHRHEASCASDPAPLFSIMVWEEGGTREGGAAPAATGRWADDEAACLAEGSDGADAAATSAAAPEPVSMPHVSQYLADVWVALEGEVQRWRGGGVEVGGRGMLRVATLVRDYRLVRGCLRGDGLVTWLVHAKLAADRLHALDMAAQVRGMTCA
jgi:hypothetical protein